jgi:hypothetical protein
MQQAFSIITNTISTTFINTRLVQQNQNTYSYIDKNYTKGAIFFAIDTHHIHSSDLGVLGDTSDLLATPTVSC